MKDASIRCNMTKFLVVYRLNLSSWSSVTFYIPEGTIAGPIDLVHSFEM